MRCAFCETEGKMTKEHVFPAWVGRLLHEAAAKESMLTLTPAEGEPKTWKSRLYTTQVRSVCEPCNAGWMSRLEEAVKPFLIPMLEGRGRSLHAGGQQVLATWAFKTALTADLVGPGTETIPPEHYHWMPDHDRPPDGVQVWSGRYAGPLQINHKATRALDYTPEPDSAIPAHSAYTCVIALGSVWFQVFGHPPDIEVVEVLYGAEAQPYVRQIWPSPGSYIWNPPAASLDQLDSLSSHFG